MTPPSTSRPLTQGIRLSTRHPPPWQPPCSSAGGPAAAGHCPHHVLTEWVGAGFGPLGPQPQSRSGSGGLPPSRDHLQGPWAAGCPQSGS